MGEPPRHSNTDDPEPRPDLRPPPAVPGWVKVSGIVALVLALLIAIVLLTGIGGPHGPARHEPSGDGAPSSAAGMHTVTGRVESPLAAGPTG